MRKIQEILESYYGKGRFYDKKEEEMFRIKAMLDFEIFFRCVLGHKVGDYHREVFALLKNERACLMSPRGHAKTEICSVGYVLWKAHGKSDLEIVIISSAESQSWRIIRRIRNHIEGNEMLKELKPASIKSYWSKSELVLKDRTRIASNPFTDTVRGNRIDVCICDDILKKELSDQNPAITKFFEIVEPAVDTEGSQLIVVGTPQSPFDLFHRLGEEGSGYAFKRFQCCNRIDRGKLIGPVLFPERWTVDKLQTRLNNMGLTPFLQEYMCVPMQMGQILFDYDTVIKPCINERLDELGEGTPPNSYYLGVDVALSSDRAADFTAFVVVERRSGSEPLRIVRVERPSKGTYTDKLFERIKELHRAFRFHGILIENKGNSMSLVESLTRDVETSGITKDFKTTSGEKERVVIKLQNLMMNRKIELVPSSLLINELMNMGLKHKIHGGRSLEKMESLVGKDDTVIACCLAVEAATSPLGRVGAVWV